MDPKTAIGEVMRALYAAISGPAGPRDWPALRALFAPGAELVRTVETDTGARVRDRMSVDEFVVRAGSQIERAGFHEREIAARIDVFGSVAQVWSTYEALRDPAGAPFARGVNGVQMFFEDGAWRITHLVWDDERPGTLVPPEHLPPPRDDADEERYAASVVANARLVAVVGMKDDPMAPAFTVPEAMASRGIRVVPVNPKLERVLGERALASVTELSERPDVIQIFRRSDAIPAIAAEIVALPTPLRPPVVWLQSGIRSDEAARTLAREGIVTLADRCFAVDMAKHRRAPAS